MQKIQTKEIIDYLANNFNKSNFLQINQTFIIGQSIESGIPFTVKNGNLYSTKKLQIKDLFLFKLI